MLLGVMPEISHVISGIGIFNVQSSDAQEYGQDEHADHETRLRVQIDIYPATYEQEQE